ncbi:MAG: hypothetical protein ED557_04655 [Balneola sp.]|nr:MAG: hypothetical protein ED557_04655 [Balneola sp.]
MNNKIVAVIPVKEKSDRVESKNFKPFIDGKSLFERKLDQLIESNSFDEIFISSNSETAKKLAKERGVQYIDRSDDFCNNIVPWSDVIHEVVSSLPVSDVTSVAWCHTTSPFFSNFADAVNTYKELGDEYNGLVAVTRFNGFIVNEKCQPLNYSWGVWHKYSQFLDKLFSISGALFIAKKMEMLKNRYVISTNPLLYETDELEAIDIDTPFDFEMAKLIHKNRDKLRINV